MSDVQITDHGSIVLFQLNTLTARRWVAHNVPEDAPFFGDALAVEPRDVEALACGMAADGLEVR